MYNPSSVFQKTIRKASPKTARKMNKEERTRVRYLVLHDVDKRAKRVANLTAQNRNINYVRKSLDMYTKELERARAQNWSNHDIRLHALAPYPRLTLRKIIYYLKQHLKQLEVAKFLAGRKAAEFMMPKARAHFMNLI